MGVDYHLGEEKLGDESLVSQGLRLSRRGTGEGAGPRLIRAENKPVGPRALPPTTGSGDNGENETVTWGTGPCTLGDLPHRPRSWWTFGL